MTKQWISRLRSTLISIWNNTTIRGFCCQNLAVVVCMRMAFKILKQNIEYSLHIMQNCAQNA